MDTDVAQLRDWMPIPPIRYEIAGIELFVKGKQWTWD
jgi:hypothetical protein